MKIILHSSDISILTRWEKHLNKHYEVDIFDDSQKLLELEDSIIIISSCVNLENKNLFFKKLIENRNKILLCEREPNLPNAKNYFSLGVLGYANSLMSSSYIISAIESIKNGFVWLLPQITTELLKDVNEAKKEDDDISIFDSLTPTEKRVASLLKDGFKNQEICEMLKISINTVKKHVGNIYEKLNVRDRIEFSNLFI